MVSFSFSRDGGSHCFYLPDCCYRSMSMCLDFEHKHTRTQRRRKQFKTGVAKNSNLPLIPGDEGQRVFLSLKSFSRRGEGVQMTIFEKLCQCPPKRVWRNHTSATPLFRLVWRPPHQPPNFRRPCTHMYIYMCSRVHTCM